MYRLYINIKYLIMSYNCIIGYPVFKSDVSSLTVGPKCHNKHICEVSSKYLILIKQNHFN